MFVGNRISIQRIGLRLSNAYILQAGAQAVLVDAGSPGECDRILETLRASGIGDPDWIFVTHAHYDHMGAAAKLKRATGAKLVIQEHDLEALRTGKSELGEVRGRGWIGAALLPIAERLSPVEPAEPDVVFNQHFSFPDPEIDILAIHTPGHTFGSAALLVNGSHMFAGDLISTTGGAHAQRYYAQDWAALDHSLQLIQRTRPALCYPGHGDEPLPLEELLRLKI